MQLNDYLKQTQRFLREQRMDLVNPEDLIDYINAGRREVAARAQCVRVLTLISAPVVSATITSSGNNAYSAATLVTISPPDFPSGKPPNPNGAQAIAQPIISNGQITGVSINQGGDGYFNPIATVTDPTGSGQNATVSLSIGPINELNPNQEQYNFSDINVKMFPGVGSVYTILDVSVIYANYRYSLPMYSFPTYQAIYPAVSVPIHLCAHVLLAVRSGCRRVFFRLPMAVAGLSVGIRLPCVAGQSGQREFVRSHPATVGRNLCAVLGGASRLYGTAKFECGRVLFQEI